MGEWGGSFTRRGGDWSALMGGGEGLYFRTEGEWCDLIGGWGGLYCTPGQRPFSKLLCVEPDKAAETDQTLPWSTIDRTHKGLWAYVRVRTNAFTPQFFTLL